MPQQPNGGGKNVEASCGHPRQRVGAFVLACVDVRVRAHGGRSNWADGHTSVSLPMRMGGCKMTAAGLLLYLS